MLNKIEWKEITKTKYNARIKLESHIKPNYNMSIDYLFTEKALYSTGKHIGNNGDCGKGKS